MEGFVGGSRSGSTDKSGRLGFINRRAEAWWLFKEALEPESGEDDRTSRLTTELLADLTAPTWELSARGIQIEDKAKLSKRLGRSPDCGGCSCDELQFRGSRQRLFLSYQSDKETYMERIIQMSQEAYDELKRMGFIERHDIKDVEVVIDRFSH